MVAIYRFPAELTLNTDPFGIMSQRLVIIGGDMNLMGTVISLPLLTGNANGDRQ